MFPPMCALARFCLSSIFLTGGLLGVLSPLAALEPEAADHYEQHVRPLLVQYCASCHDPDDPGNHVDFLKATTTSEIQKHRGLMGSVAAQLRNRTMPPADAEQPSEQERFQLAQWIEDHLQQTACSLGPYAGSVTTRRLNRLEYENTIRDLIGPQLGFDESFPTDGSGGEGFDNNGETLFLPPMLMERYVEAAQQILDAAIVTPPLVQRFSGNDFSPETPSASTTTRTIEAEGELLAGVVVYVAGDYQITIDAHAAEDQETQLTLKLDGLPADRFTLLPRGTSPSKPLKTTVRLERGLHAVALHVPRGQSAAAIESLQVEEQGIKRPKNAQQFHDRLFQAHERKYEKNAEAAESLLRDFAYRAFRRPVEEAELAPFLALYDRAAARDDPYEERIKLALKGILVSPQFLFRIETAPQSAELQPITDFELASRLSYFLWSSMPDEQLFRLAEEGKLSHEKVLQDEVRRMLADEKADVFYRTFVGQWLGTKEVGGSVAPVAGQFRDVYSSELAADFREEAFQLMAYMIREDRSILEFIEADYAFVNARLAKHYGLPEVEGKNLRKVEVSGGQRGGLFGLGGVHMVTSYPQRTSPVLRGAWVLETLLGTPVPSPPADLPELPRNVSKSAKTLRQQLEKHRDNPSCAACHDVIDPIGYGLDNYDIFGRWREETENGQPVDTTAVLPSGEEFDGAGELKQILLRRKEEFARHLSRKVLGYALGRSLEDPDSCTIENLVSELEANEYRFQSLIQGVVSSTPFRYRQQVDPTLSSSH